MCEVSDTALHKYITANQIELKTAQILTATGEKTANLFSEFQMLVVIAKYNPTL